MKNLKLVVLIVLILLTTTGCAKNNKRTPILQLSKVETVYIEYNKCNPVIRVAPEADKNSKVVYTYDQSRCSELPNGWVECQKVTFKFPDGTEHVCPRAEFVLSIVNYYGEQK